MTYFIVVKWVIYVKFEAYMFSARHMRLPLQSYHQSNQIISTFSKNKTVQVFLLLFQPTINIAIYALMSFGVFLNTKLGKSTAITSGLKTR